MADASENSLKRLFKSYLISGMILLAAGAGFAMFSIRQVSTLTPNAVPFYWSFHTIPQPIHGLYLEVPVGSEVLIPWLLIGLALICFSAFLLYRSHRAWSKLSKKSNMPHNPQ